MGRAIGESFREKDPAMAEAFNDGLKKMAEDRLFSCSDTELDELIDGDKEEDDSDCDDLERQFRDYAIGWRNSRRFWRINNAAQ